MDGLRVEATGETVGEAKWHALRELERLRPGLDKAGVSFQVVSEGERGLLGVGYAPARVVATVPAAASPASRPRGPAGESELAADMRELVERVAAGIGVRCEVCVAEDEETVTASCSGPELGLLIGKHGQTIDAVQYLANAIAHRRSEDLRKSVVIDAAGYRERRRATLDALAVQAAERALTSNAPVELEPMSSVERKAVHLRLQDYPGVATSSEGAEPNRYVVVVPARP